MGEGLKRICDTYGGMRVSMRGVTCDYVAKDENAATVIRQRQDDGWRHIGETPDSKFLQFTIATAKIEEGE